MRKVVGIIVLYVLSACGDKHHKTTSENQITLDSLGVVKQLERMVANDQQIQFAHRPDETTVVRDSLYRLQEQIFRANTDTVKKLFKDHGFLGFDHIGKKASSHFWILVQHADHDIPFQLEVLDAMQKEVAKKNANGSEYAYLTDRVLTNQGKNQLFGTQVAYTDDLWVLPKPLKDSISVNERREAVGLEKLEVYLNEMMEMHYQMNQAAYQAYGLDGPRKYTVQE